MYTDLKLNDFHYLHNNFNSKFINSKIARVKFKCRVKTNSQQGN